MNYDEKNVIELIEDCAQLRGLAVSTFCLRALNDGQAYKKLKAGGTITIRRVLKIIDYDRTHPVKGKDKPDDKGVAVHGIAG